MRKIIALIILSISLANVSAFAESICDIDHVSDDSYSITILDKANWYKEIGHRYENIDDAIKERENLLQLGVCTRIRAPQNCEIKRRGALYYIMRDGREYTNGSGILYFKYHLQNTNLCKF